MTEGHLLDYRTAVDSYLAALLSSQAIDPRLREACTYSVLPGGKRIRAVLLLAMAHDLGGDWRDGVPAAAAVELLHCASLIHDDLPALDDDDVRRGKPTCHRAFDEATALLAGDYLVPLATVCAMDTGIGVDARLRLLVELNRAFLSLLDGQQRDLALKDGDTTDLELVHRLKTGALFRYCTSAAALIAGRPDSELERAGVLGERLGVVFQLLDDLADGERDRAELEQLGFHLERLRDELREAYRVVAGAATPNALEGRTWPLIDALFPASGARTEVRHAE
jgi:geranylgeranyl pyrophosphate synthase